MSEDLTEDLGQLERELAEKLEEAAHVGDCLIVLGNRVKREPWHWTLSAQNHGRPPSLSALTIETVIKDALDKKHLKKLLEEIRTLRNRKENLERRLATKVKFNL